MNKAYLFKLFPDNSWGVKVCERPSESRYYRGLGYKYISKENYIIIEAVKGKLELKYFLGLLNQLGVISDEEMVGRF